MIGSNELTVRIGSRGRKVFLQNGFYSSSCPTQYVHKHNYPEVHLVSGGRAEFSVDDKRYTVNDGEILVIPGGIYHGCIFMNDGAKHTAFQIDQELSETGIYSVGGGVAFEFIAEIEKCGKNGDHSRISAFISLICSYFTVPVAAKKITDSGFLISEFFSNSYGVDARLEALAEILHLSPRQTERLVEEHTGRSFREELTATRMSVADRLIKISDMPLCEVAQYVGYRSYAGFWKAYQKYKNETKKENSSDEGDC